MIPACDTSPTFPVLYRRASLARPRVTLSDADLAEYYLAGVRNTLTVFWANEALRIVPVFEPDS